MDGVLNLNKPRGISSYQAVRRVQRALGARKAGHAGTLDPQASGVLVVCLGRATKLFEQLQEHDKEYLATVRLGVETDTYDAEGRVVAEGEVPSDLSPETIAELLKAFEGEVEQVPPMYSALKFHGRPLYKLARKGITVPRKPRRVQIETVELLEWTPPELRIRIVCSRGTYVRTLAHEIGRRLGCGGHLAELVRTRSGPFRLEEAVPLDRVLAVPQEARRCVLPLEVVRRWTRPLTPGEEQR